MDISKYWRITDIPRGTLEEKKRAVEVVLALLDSACVNDGGSAKAFGLPSRAMSEKWDGVMFHNKDSEIWAWDAYDKENIPKTFDENVTFLDLVILNNDKDLIKEFLPENFLPLSKLYMDNPR